MVVRKNISHLLVFVWSSRASFWLSVHISLSQCYIPEGRNNWPYVQLAQHLFSSVNFSRCHLSLHDHKCGQTFANMEKWTRTHSSFTMFYLSYNRLCSFSAPRVGSTHWKLSPELMQYTVSPCNIWHTVTKLHWWGEMTSMMGNTYHQVADALIALIVFSWCTMWSFILLTFSHKGFRDVGYQVANGHQWSIGLRCQPIGLTQHALACPVPHSMWLRSWSCSCTTLLALFQSANVLLLDSPYHPSNAAA